MFCQPGSVYPINSEDAVTRSKANGYGTSPQPGFSLSVDSSINLSEVPETMTNQGDTMKFRGTCRTQTGPLESQKAEESGQDSGGRTRRYAGPLPYRPRRTKVTSSEHHCRICNKFYSTRKQLRKHVNTFHADQPFELTCELYLKLVFGLKGTTLEIECCAWL